MLTKESSNEEVIAKARIYMAKQKQSQAWLAKKIMLSRSYLSRFLSGKADFQYEQTVKEALVEFLNLMERQENSRKPELRYVETSQSRHITALLNYCRDNKGFGLFHGPSGVGKTTTISHYRDNEKFVAVISANQQRSIMVLLRRIANEIGIKIVRKRVDELQEQIEQTLAGSNWLVIIDEAQQLTFRQLETIRCIYDSTHTAFVLSATAEIVERMQGRYRHEYDQLYSRFDMVIELERKIEKENITKMINGIPCGRGVAGELFKVAQEQGHYRHLQKCVNMAVNIARNNVGGNGNPYEVAVQDVRAALTLLWKRKVA